MLKVSVILPSLKLSIDTQAVAREAATGMRDFWATQLDNGKQPDGEALPLNKENKPLGRGRGTLVRGWKVRNAGKGSAAVEPYKRGRYAIAVAKLRRRGLRFQSFEGEAGDMWRVLAREAALNGINRAKHTANKPTQEWTDETGLF